MSIHLKGLKPGDLGEATIIVGDPGRVELISQDWTDKKKLVDSREFIVVSGLWNNHLVSICSTGIGVGSTEIAVIELIENGAKKIVRCGGCGAWVDGIEPGDLIINSAMARTQGMLGAYVSDNYPAVSNSLLTSAIIKKAEKSGFKTHTGIGLTSESYYFGQGRVPDIQTSLNVEKDYMNYWTDRNILNCEMETAVLFLLGSLYNIPVANCLVVHVSRKNEKWTNDEDYRRIHKTSSEIVLSCLVDETL